MTDSPLHLTTRVQSDPEFTLKTAITEALGYASLCWSETPGGTFDSAAASAAAEDLHAAAQILGDDLRARLQEYVDIQRQTVLGIREMISGLSRIATVDTTELEGAATLLGLVADDLDKILAGTPLQKWAITGEIPA
jgi:hypothetical protein